MRAARPVVLSDEQRDTLETRARARSASARSVERARIVLLAASGMQDKQIAAKLRIMPEKAAPVAEPVPGRRSGGLAERCATTGKNAHDHAIENPGCDPEDDSGEAFERNSMEYADDGGSNWPE